MRMTRYFEGALAMTFVASLAGCGAGAPGEDLGGDESTESVDERGDAISANPGVCYNGMTTTVKKVEPFGLRCKLADLPDMVSYVCATDPTVCDFLKFKLDGHGTLQCTSYVVGSTTKYCADVVDRQPDGSSLEDPKDGLPPYYRNYLVTFVNDDHFPLHPDVSYWNSLLGDPAMTAPPVELSFTGRIQFKPTAYVKNTQPQPPNQNRLWRLIKHDPRTCGGCGMYWGPSRGYVNDLNDLVSWYPSFNPGTCAFEKKPGAAAIDWQPLTLGECNNEAVYRANGR